MPFTRGRRRDGRTVRWLGLGVVEYPANHGGTLAAHHRAGSKRMSQIVEPHFLMVGAA